MWGRLVVCVLVGHSSTAAAQAASGDASDALPGLERTARPAVGAAPWSFAASTSYGFTESVLTGDDAHHRGGLAVAGAARPAEWLAISLRFDGRFDKHTDDAAGDDDGWIGDVRLAVRGSRALAPRWSAGIELSAWAPSESAFDAGDGLSFDGLALIEHRPGDGRLALAANAGARLDRSAGSVPDADGLSRADRLALGVSDSNAVLFGAGAVYDTGRVALFGEWSWDLLVGDDAPAARESPMRLGVGARWAVSDAVGVRGWVEASVARRPDVAAGEPLVPVDPAVAVGVGMTYRFATGARGRGRLADGDGGGDDVAVAPRLVRVTGTVVERDGSPAAGVDVRGEPETGAAAETVTGADGRFELMLPEGPARIVIPKQRSYLETSVDATVTGGDLTVALELRRDLPPGQVRGLVRTLSGKPLRATVRIEPSGETATSGDDGSFRIDVAPGAYEIVVEAPGRAPQRRAIAVEQNGVTVINIELRPAK